jgi:Tfp pilus assembly protein PilN
VAAHDLTALVGRWSRAGRAAWLHRIDEEVNLLLLEGPRIRLSRSFPWTDAETLAREIRRSMGLLRWDTLTGLWVSGDASPALEDSPALLVFGPVTPPPFTRAAARAIDELEEPASGLQLLALGVALGPRRPALNLLPEPLRPRQLTPGQLATIASAIVTALLGLSVIFAREYTDQRYMARLNQAIRALNPELRVVEQANAELEKKRLLMATVRALEEGNLRPLPLLRELTEIIPQEAWLTTLNLDAKGMELSGQAVAASQLIPLLENSPRLERVEFSSPVTKGRDKEQFRIRASWESPPKPAAAAVPQPSPRGAPRR